MSPTEITPLDTDNPPTSPPLNFKADAVTTPLALTLNEEAEINNSAPVALPLIKKFVDDSASPVIVNPPIEPSLAVTLPLIITSPALLKWKLEELISTFPFEPLMN